MYTSDKKSYNESNSLSNFTQANADNASFPAAGKLVSRDFSYDTRHNIWSMTTQNVKGRLSRARSYRLGVLAVEAYYSYDDYGRIAWVIYTGLSGNKRVEYSYDRQGNITQKIYKSTTTAHQLTTSHEYDTLGRLWRIKTTHSGVSNKKEADYTYFPTGQTRRLVLGDPKAQGVDYRYNTRDWLININNQNLTQSTPSDDSNDRFGMVIGYDQLEHIGSALGAPAQFNGNISWLIYALHGVNYSGSEGTTRLVGYRYGYDKANRLLIGAFGYHADNEWWPTVAYNEKDIAYHKNGNITALKRYNQSGGLMHNYSYVYYTGTNRLKNVTGSDDRYVYDANGNVQHDLDSSIGFIIYDIFNLPVAVYTTAGVLRRYYYDHNGNRVRKYVGSYTNYINGVDGRTEVITNHNGSWATYLLHGLDAIGQIRRSGTTWNRFYFLKDHLGSIKVIVNASGNRVAHTDLYPFGFEMSKRSADPALDGPGRVSCTGPGGPDCRYKFIGIPIKTSHSEAFIDPQNTKLIGPHIDFTICISYNP